ncbi:MAG: hypothetical protein KF847_15435 [Pirellulales bacterium]|nr:hypothetical protein [Pirellulales bacterium]
MLPRLVHAAIAFVVTAAMYWGYVAAVVPVVEPPATIREVQTPDAGQVTRGQESVAEYQRLLAAYFKPGHWTSRTPPKVFENRQAMLVISDFEETDRGQIIARNCAMLMFPTPRDRGGTPPRDAIIIEPLEGAVLEGRSSSGSPAAFSKLDRAWLRGEVRITSDMREPGPADDLELTTREIYIREDLIRTDQRVEMRLGPHFGGGRGLEIKLLATENIAGEAKTDAIAGRFESLEISDEVMIEIVPGELSLPGDEKSPKSAGAPEPPITIKSQGPFRIDFGNYVASFLEKVHVRQVHSDGVLDAIDADEVNLYFARAKANKKTAARASSSPLGAGFELATIEAKGSKVVVNAPGRNAAAECKRMRIELRQRRVTVEGDDEAVTLAYRGAEIHAPLVQYVHPAEGSEQAIGQLVASGGGFLKAILDKRRPLEPLEVRWTESLRIDRVEGAPVLKIRGRPRLTLGNTGRMWADALELTLRERPADPAAAATSPLPWAVAPERLRAAGNVAIDSPELEARVDQLHMQVNYPSGSPQELGLHGADGSGRRTTGGQANPLAQLGGAGNRTYRAEGRSLELTANVRAGKTELAAVALEGNVRFEEAPDPTAKEAPLRIEAQRVVVVEADTPHAKIDIVGRPAAAGVESQLAQVTARGATLRAPQISMIRGRSKLQIESPGEVLLVTDRDLTGQPLARPEPMSITWQQWMRLDRNRLTFRGGVVCRNASGWLSTRQLGVNLSQEVSFDGAAGAAKAEVVQLDCSDGVVAEFDQRDEAGITSHQHVELASILANQQTGAIRGEGPGWIESVHLATGKGMLALAAPGVAPPSAGPSPNEPGQRLRHLRVDFARGVEGSLRDRSITLVGDVRATYGPVDSWEQRLQRAVGAGPGPNVVWLASDRLTVAESPLARVNRPPGATGLAELELTAIGRVKIDGEAPGRGLFAATAGRASYDSYKGMFLLEGDGAVPATIHQQDFIGAPPNETVAQKLTYNLRTGQVGGQFNKIEWNQFDVSRPPATTQQR